MTKLVIPQNITEKLEKFLKFPGQCTVWKCSKCSKINIEADLNNISYVLCNGWDSKSGCGKVFCNGCVPKHGCSVCFGETHCKKCGCGCPSKKNEKKKLYELEWREKERKEDAIFGATKEVHDEWYEQTLEYEYLDEEQYEQATKFVEFLEKDTGLTCLELSQKILFNPYHNKFSQTFQEYFLKYVERNGFTLDMFTIDKKSSEVEINTKKQRIDKFVKEINKKIEGGEVKVVV